MPTLNHDHYTTLWTRQLLHEFEDICSRYQVTLPTPTIEIFTANRRMGEWREASQTIRINHELIATRSWSVTINIFKHEMAHQLCRAWGYQDAGHGPRFEEACLRLGVPPVYRTARGDSPEIFEELESDSQLVNEGRRFFSKVEKLLALGRSTNEHEAALAMEKANELIAKYNLKLSADDTDRRYRCSVISTGKQRIHGWQRSIAAILRDYFYVKVIQAETYDPLRDLRCKTIELFGLAENVAVAEYCYHFLERELNFLWQQNKGRFPGTTITEKNSYYLGVLSGFQQKLKSQRLPSTPAAPAAQASASALTVAADHGLNNFIAMCYPRLRTIRHAGPKIYRTTFQHGTADGKNIVLHKGVANHDGNRGRFLPSTHDE